MLLQAAAADGKGEGQLPPTLKLMQQNTRLVVLTLEARPFVLKHGGTHSTQPTPAMPT